MKRIAVTFVAVLMLTGTGVVHAGVVVDEQQIVDQGGSQPVTHTRTVMIQGNKQKSVMEGGTESVVTDLDTGTMTMMSAPRKAYVQVPFPPQGSMATMMQANTASTLKFKKTGSHQKVAGYTCDDYIGSGNMGGNELTVNGCFSTSAPGASDFTAFQKTMAAKVKGTSMGMMGQVPDGVPLKIDSTTKVTHISMPGMSPEQTAKISKMLANRPPTVTHMTVMKITTQKLAADTFEPPAGYQKQEMRMPNPGTGGPGMNGPGPGAPPAGGGSSSKVPE
jgi:hypothetical protein